MSEWWTLSPNWADSLGDTLRDNQLRSEAASFMPDGGIAQPQSNGFLSNLLGGLGAQGAGQGQPPGMFSNLLNGQNPFKQQPNPSVSSLVEGAKAGKGLTPAQSDSYSLYRSAGLPHAGASAIIANLSGEGTPDLNPNAMNNTGTDKGGVINPRGAYGIGQWNGVRQEQLQNFAQSQGMDYRDRNLQLQFTAWDLKNNYPDLWAQLKDPNSNPQSNLQRLVAEYERPKDVSGAIAKRSQYLSASYPQSAGPTEMAGPVQPSSFNWAKNNADFGPGENLVTVPTAYGKDLTANSQAAPHFQSFLADLKNAGYDVNTLYSYAPRDIAGTNTLSEHAFGNAIDINPGANPVTHGALKTDLPENIRDIAAKNSLVWGGDMHGSKKDTMHFEYNPNVTGGGQGTQTAGMAGPVQPLAIPGMGPTRLAGAVPSPDTAPAGAPGQGAVPSAGQAITVPGYEQLGPITRAQAAAAHSANARMPGTDEWDAAVAKGVPPVNMGGVTEGRSVGRSGLTPGTPNGPVGFNPGQIRESQQSIDAQRGGNLDERIFNAIQANKAAGRDPLSGIGPGRPLDPNSAVGGDSYWTPERLAAARQIVGGGAAAPVPTTGPYGAPAVVGGAQAAPGPYQPVVSAGTAVPVPPVRPATAPPAYAPAVGGLVPDGYGGWVPATNSQYDPRTGQFLSGPFSSPTQLAGQMPTPNAMPGGQGAMAQPLGARSPLDMTPAPGSTGPSGVPAYGGGATTTPMGQPLQYSPQLLQRMLQNPYSRETAKLYLQQQMQREEWLYQNQIQQQQQQQHELFRHNLEQGHVMTPDEVTARGLTGGPYFQAGNGAITLIKGQEETATKKDFDTENADRKSRGEPRISFHDFRMESKGRDVQPKLVDVPVGDGKVQKKWIKPGETDGIDVGPPRDPTDKPPTEQQSNSVLFATRMRESNKVLSDPEMAAELNDPTQRAKNAIPGIGNWAVSDKFQEAQQAERDFINAVLRRESGAAINESEFVNARQQYIPQPFDRPAVLRDKAKNRETAIRGIEAGAGPAYQRQQQSQRPMIPMSDANELKANPQGRQEFDATHGTLAMPTPSDLIIGPERGAPSAGGKRATPEAQGQDRVQLPKGKTLPMVVQGVRDAIKAGKFTAEQGAAVLRGYGLDPSRLAPAQ